MENGSHAIILTVTVSDVIAGPSELPSVIINASFVTSGSYCKSNEMIWTAQGAPAFECAVSDCVGGTMSPLIVLHRWLRVTASGTA